MKKIVSILTGLTMLAGTAAAMPVHAEEPVKNFNYYWNLDDYSVYCEFVELYGKFDDRTDRVPDASLPKMTDLPWYDVAKYYVTNDTYCPPFIFRFREDAILNDEEMAKLSDTPSYFGFPDTWSIADHKTAFEVLVACGSNGSGEGNEGSLLFDFYRLEDPDYAVYGKQDIPVMRSFLDVYRILLTLEHSQFAQDHTVVLYGRWHGVWFDDFLGNYSLPGDPNEDGIVNAEDAAEVLVSAAKEGAGETTELTEAQIAAADVNEDGRFDAADASVILRYAAVLGTGDRYTRIKDLV